MTDIVQRITRTLRRVLLDDRSAVLKMMPRNGVCAEIGVWKGNFSARIHKATAPTELHLIDPWMFQPQFPDRMYGGSVAKQQTDMDLIYRNVVETIGSRPGVSIHRKTSEEALAGFKDDYFDWVYVDGNHCYENVLRDLQLCLLKVKPGGFIAGDDYYWGAELGYPVGRAVSEIVAEHASRRALRILGGQFVIQKS